MSTAAAVLMQEANGGNAITSDAALATLSGQVNAQEVLDLATAIKLAVDEPEKSSAARRRDVADDAHCQY